MKLLASPKTLAVSLLSVIISVAAGGFTVKANDLAIRKCVTSIHAQQSFNHYINFSDLLGTGEVKLLPRSIVSFYQDRLDCIQDRKGFGATAGYERQLELLPRLQMVDEVIDGSNLCLKISTNKQKICASD